MWKYLVAFVVVLGLTVYVSAQNQRHTEQAAQHGTQPSNAVIPPIAHDNQPQRNQNKPQWNPPSWYRFFAWPDGVTAWAIFLTLMAIAEQTKQTSKSADAALLNAQAVINSERPWILINIETVDPEDIDAPYTYRVCAINAGRTPAVLDSVLGGHCAFKKHPVDFTELPLDFHSPFTLPKQDLIVSQDSFMICRLNPESIIESSDWSETNPQKLFVYGRLYYWDVFTDRTLPGAKPYVTQWIFRYDSITEDFCRCESKYRRNT